MRELVSYVLHKPHEDCRNVRSQGAATRIDGAVIIALDDSLGHRPAHGFKGVVGYHAGVGEFTQVSGAGYVVALVLCVSVQDGDHLLAGDCVVGAE